jgi:serine/threonine-protein kinase
MISRGLERTIVARETRVSISTVATALPVRSGAVRCCGICGAAYRTEFQRCPNDGGELSLHESDPLIGQILGDHYEVEALIGEGAMGRVYRAHHTLLPNKRFAVKVLLGDLAVEPEMRMRFAREADATSLLEHPALVSVHDFGRTRTGLMFLVLELVDGETLGHVVRRGPMSPARVIRIARQLCQGLAHAHAKGVIHRDLKPDNILLTAIGTPGEQARISDFGLAVTRDDDARLTRSGVVCTPAYAAPEQLTGRTIDHRADLYALGSTLFEMLSGGVPVFAGDAQEVTSRKLAGEARSLADVAPHTPGSLVRLIHRLLEADPAKRPPSALDVLARLDNAGTDPTLQTQARAPRHGRRIAVACVAAAALGALGAAPSRIAATVPGMPRLDDRAAPSPQRRSSHEQAPAAARVVVAPHAPAHEPVVIAQHETRALVQPAPPHTLRAAPRALRVVSLAVEGSLPRSVVERAVARAMPAVKACRFGGRVVAASFTIDDSRRATDVHTASACLAQALAHVRTEIAPDVGDAAVELKLGGG